MLDDARPLPQQLVPAPVVAALEPAVPGRVALEAPYELTRTALDLQSGRRAGERGRGKRGLERKNYCSKLDHYFS